MNVAMQWNLQGDIDSTLLLQALKVSDALSWGLNLDDEHLNYSNNIESIAKDPILREGGIKFPDGGGRFNMGNLCANIHEVCDG